MSAFRKFTILNSREEATGTDEVEVLFNLSHIVSIKPIRISTPNKLRNGFWIRTTNGKKYKAVMIPAELLKEIGEQYQGPIVYPADTDSDETSFQ